MVWFAQGGSRRSDSTVFVFDFNIDESMRGKGYGRAAILETENEVMKNGITDIALDVFGHNTTAIELYKSVGFEATNIQMEKKLGQP